MISLRDISFRHDRGPRAATALHAISFDVPQGGFRWLLGPSGAGKSTLLRLLGLSARASEGEMTLLGVLTTRARRPALTRLRRRIGVVHQDFALLPDLSVGDNVALPLRLQDRPEDEIADAVAAMLGWVGLAGRERDAPARLSGGEQQRVAVARAVIHQPELLLADEPTNALQEDQGRRLMELFNELNAMGTTVVVATHNESLVQRYPGRALWLDGGRLVHDG
ncbi:cell division ATP-binding protein FtsE [Ameyamaea chiangmaiensis NBRC 103196]|uniref:ATP-binding cassette domain-containing protein n=1 Tax=Ameyamaea chiangmaiensis TaxID=442969 RepID=A0A850PHA3_9PROT|nr:ATP-binding cassette domain-containing protein [Ameyamaea chiangmaiensis]MBS4074458.1 ATP-binding cassette domain-containing protein [Ameyamaea chiangmaiensis]NVN42029.1 ATP-binding cassette domain-containing protein [Ameyamaea chiangmaiensis]GBQ72109.1 cell division ATP-binding protein FtsE [Ameyamaea chiangmaiensis NBRC 103196]